MIICELLNTLHDGGIENSAIEGTAVESVIEQNKLPVD
jgi:hypothetical protein